MTTYQIKEESSSYISSALHFLYHAKNSVRELLEPKKAKPRYDTILHSKYVTQKKTSNTQRDFLSSIVHELKTPLSAIIAFSENLQEDVKNPNLTENCIDYAKEINHAAHDLDEIIHDILDVGSNVNTGFSVDLSKEIDAVEALRRSVKLNYDYALKRQITLQIDIASDIRLIRLDFKRLKQILINLISNAVKYSPRNSKIEISAHNIVKDDSSKYLQIIISDQGFGMTKQQIHTAFEKYKTIKNPNSGIVDSFGLGLPITKELVELQNGSLDIQSKIGKGTKMLLVFPYAD